MTESNTSENFSYFEKRMKELGITPEVNQVELWQSKPDGPGNVLVQQPIFRPHEKGIIIVPYSLERNHIRIQKEGSKQKESWSIIRLEKPIVKPDGSTIKYLMPKGGGSFPFFPPALVKKYESSEKIRTLFLTEGFFKAMKGSAHGLDIIGLASITHMKDRDKGILHQSILFLIKQCKVERVVWLTDGDCLDISQKEINEENDLFKRPNSFYQSVATFKQLLDDYDLDKYFMHIDIDTILSEYKNLKRDDVKGLDDLLCSFPDRTAEIVDALNSVSTSSMFFCKFRITTGLGKVYAHFHLRDATEFYLFHVERRNELKDKNFIFHGTKYKYDEHKGRCEVLVPGEAEDYFRVGNTYYKFIWVPNKYGQDERKFEMRLKGTIIDDYGKAFIEHIPKYESFCNVPDHVTFHQVLRSCFNVYNPLEHQPLEEDCEMEDCPTIIAYLKHVFGEHIVKFKHPVSNQIETYSNFDMALDYMQLLYQQPAEKLPILCLVSKENNTGKSTLGKLLRQIFGGNCAIVGNQDLVDQFNAHWTTKLVVICDEAKIDKHHVVEKVKMLSTAEKVMMNAKGKDQVEIDCFLKFILITNNEDNFIQVTEEDIRFWVIKVPVITRENPNIMELMIEEIPAFLSFLNRRKLKTDKLNRMWFHPSLIRTTAFQRVVEFSKPQVVKEIRSKIRELFFETGEETIMMTRTAIQEDLLQRQKYEDFYLENVLKTFLKLEQYHKYEYRGVLYATLGHVAAILPEGKSIYDADIQITRKTLVHRHQYPKWDRRVDMNTRETQIKLVWVKNSGRPYVFNRMDFLTEEEIAGNVPDPELASMATTTEPPASSDDQVPRPPESIQNDLPF